MTRTSLRVDPCWRAAPDTGQWRDTMTVTRSGSSVTIPQVIGLWRDGWRRQLPAMFPLQLQRSAVGTEKGQDWWSSFEAPDPGPSYWWLPSSFKNFMWEPFFRFKMVNICTNCYYNSIIIIQTWSTETLILYTIFLWTYYLLLPKSFHHQCISIHLPT